MSRFHVSNYKAGEDASKEVCALPVDYQINRDVRLVTITGRGDVVLENLMECMDAIVGQDAMGFAKLVDTRAAVGHFSDDDFMMLGAHAQAYAFHDPRGPVAIVATNLLADLRSCDRLGSRPREKCHRIDTPDVRKSSYQICGTRLLQSPSLVLSTGSPPLPQFGGGPAFFMSTTPLPDGRAAFTTAQMVFRLWERRSSQAVSRPPTVDCEHTKPRRSLPPRRSSEPANLEESASQTEAKSGASPAAA
jgi:hypothetical protein